jgi:hypothetical protein
MFSLCQRGAVTLAERTCQSRLAEVSTMQVRSVIERMVVASPLFPVIDDEGGIIIETVRTRDITVHFPDGSTEAHRVRPRGNGWRILRNRERYTIWARRSPEVSNANIRVNRWSLP